MTTATVFVIAYSRLARINYNTEFCVLAKEDRYSRVQIRRLHYMLAGLGWNVSLFAC